MFSDKRNYKDEEESEVSQEKKNKYHVLLASLVVQLVKNLPAIQETWVWSLGWEDSLEKE